MVRAKLTKKTARKFAVLSKSTIKRLKATVRAKFRVELEAEVRAELREELLPQVSADAEEEEEVRAEIRRRRAASALDESDMEEFWGGACVRPWVYYVHSAQEVREYWADRIERAAELGGRRWTMARWPENLQAEYDGWLMSCQEYVRGEAEQRAIWEAGAEERREVSADAEEEEEVRVGRLRSRPHTPGSDRVPLPLPRGKGRGLVPRSKWRT